MLNTQGFLTMYLIPIDQGEKATAQGPKNEDSRNSLASTVFFTSDHYFAHFLTLLPRLIQNQPKFSIGVREFLGFAKP